MAKITREDVLKLARLSNIKLRDDEIDNFAKDLDEILKYVEQINSAEVLGLEPTDQVTGLKNITRPDEIVDYGVSAEDLLKNAPDVENSQIKVKRIL